MERNYYIELRVYLKDDASFDDANNSANDLQDIIIDALDPSTGAPEIFTQDVSFAIVRIMPYGISKSME